MKQETDAERFKRYVAHFGKNPKWDEKTQKSADMARAVYNRQPAPPISFVQEYSMKARLVKDQDQYHIVEEEIPLPEQDDIRTVFLEIVRKLGDVPFDIPTLAPVQVEWIGRKRNASHAFPVGSLKEKLDCLGKDCTEDLTMIHIHGGAYFQSDPKAHRAGNTELASLTGGRIVSVRYRLAPQSTFPTPWLDVLLVYLSLIYPPKDSHHAAINPSRTMLIGDSVGGQLSYGLLQMIRCMNLSNKTIKFHHHTITPPLPSPAGCAILGAVGTQLLTLPSHRRNSINDIFPPEMPWSFPHYPRCSIWPTTPPRPHVTGRIETNQSPLLTPALMKVWDDIPPLWFGMGQDQFYDGGKAIARQAARAGINVTWVEFEAMPHCFPHINGFHKIPQARVLMQKWASFCVDCVDGKIAKRPQRVIASCFGYDDMKERETPLTLPTDPSLEEVERILNETLRSEGEKFRLAWQAFGAVKL